MSLPKPFYQRGPVQIFHGDCLELLPHLPRVDAVVTDPPYGVDFDTDYTRFSGGLSTERRTHNRIANDSREFDPSPFLSFRRVVLFGANCFSDKLPCGTWLIWDKRFKNGAAMLADAEAAWMNSGHGIYIKAVTSQGFVRPEPIEHPTQKPVSVIEWCLDKASNEGDTILDPFLGSGTTAVACIRTGRQCVGIELEEKYCEIAAKRCDRELDQKRLPFDEPRRVETQGSLFD
jgi:DNA modification methylase